MASVSRRRFLQRTMAVGASGLLPGLHPTAFAQAYPTRPVRYVVAYPPGGTSDVVARAITPGLSSILGQQFVVDNRPGGGGVIAIEAVAKAPADGYTLLHTSVSFLTVTPQLTKVSYDPFKDLDPVAFIGTNINVLVVNPEVPARTLREFIDYARANPGKLYYASSGSGTGAHILGEYFKQMTGIQAEHVPYKGSAPAMTDLLAGRTHFMLDPAVTAQVRSGKLRALAISGAKSLELLPGVPPIETVLPNWNPPQWYNFISAPANTPDAIKNRLNGATATVLADPKVIKLLRDNNYEPGTATPEEIRARLKADYASTGEILRANNIKLD
jgi:tripartite-type tricarboxylate transporter receptor subunit TctC